MFDFIFLFWICFILLESKLGIEKYRDRKISNNTQAYF